MQVAKKCLPASHFVNSCLQDSLGRQYLKLRPTSPAAVHLVCGKSVRNASLSNLQKLTDLKAMRNNALLEQSGQASSASLFGGEEDGHANKKRKVCFKEQIVQVNVAGAPVSILCPAKRACISDLMVQLDKDMLYATLMHLRSGDIDQEATATKRSYNLTGKYRKD